jgi:beta-N-acetylhexosaminidase
VLAALVVAVAAGVAWLFLDDEGSGPRVTGVSPKADRLATSLSIPEQVRTVLAVGFVGSEPAAGPAFAIGPEGLGGVLVRAENWLGVAQGSALIEQIGENAGGSDAGLPIVIAPQEGGPGRAFPDLPPAERQVEIGDFADPQRAGEWALRTGVALRDAGFDAVLSPLADVASLFSPIADRSFSDSPQIAATMTAGALQGCRAADIACAVGHFPGLGGASQDTDDGPATVSLDRSALEQRDLPAFAAAIAERAPIIVLAHAFYAAFDPVTPASLSPQIVTGLLRDQMRFRGVAMTDDLSTGAIRATSTVPTAAIDALRAGADLLLVSDPADQDGLEKAIERSVDRGELPPDRLREAAARVLELKSRLGLLG